MGMISIRKDNYHADGMLNLTTHTSGEFIQARKSLLVDMLYRALPLKPSHIKLKMFVVNVKVSHRAKEIKYKLETELLQKEGYTVV